MLDHRVSSSRRPRRVRTALAGFLAACVAIGALGASASAGGLEISDQVVASGGGTSSGGDFVLDGTVGQAVASPAAAAGDFTFAGGYWPGGIDDGAACPGDLDGNMSVGFSDLNLVLGAWGPCPAPCPPDVDGNGSVGFSDLNTILGAWGSCVPY